MATAEDIKFYESLSQLLSLGGDIRTSTEIVSGTDANLFDHVTKAQVDAAPFTEYKCMYIKNTSTETIKNVSFWMTAGTPSSHTSVNWGFENPEEQHEYKYQPYEDFNGTSDFVDTGVTTNRIQFTVAAWFKTSKDYSADEGLIVCKGVYGSELSTDNFNILLMMGTDEKIIAGFEESGGTNHFATSTSTYNDNKWHLAVVTYNQVAVKLYVDGAIVDTHATTATPNASNTRSITIGSDHGGVGGFWDGQIDDVRVWSNDIQADEVLELYLEGVVPDTDDVVYANKFGSNNHSNVAQIIPNINTAPVGVNFNGSSTQPDSPNIGTLGPGGYKAIWVKWTVEAGCPDVPRDRVIFNFIFDTTTTGEGSPPTGGGGGGSGSSGGNPQPDVTNWKIAVTGDWGEENETDDVVDQIVDGDFDLVIGVGDNSYTSSDNEWYGIVKAIDDNQGSPIRFETCMGNHDSASNIKEHFGYKNIYTSFDFQNTHTLILSTEHDMDIGSAQHNFAKADLEKQATRSNIDWIFVVFHRPMLGPDSDHDINEMDQVQNYMDMFVNNGVTFVFQGHNHHWFRSYPVKRNGSSATRIVNTDGPYTVGDPNDWLIAVTSGAGGHDSPGSLYDLDNEPAYSAYQNNSNNGIFSIVASNGGQTLTCKFINTSNSTKHSFVINKS